MSHPSRPPALLFALLVTLLLPELLVAQGGTVRGTVTDTLGAPVSGVSIALEGTGLGTTTQVTGTYEFRNVADGIYTLRTRRVGYNPMSARIAVSSGGIVEQNFRLTPRPIQLAPIDVTVGSRAQHTAAEELAVPVDVYTAEVIARQGTTETSQILQALAPSVNFPRQTVTDATDIVRPFTLRGLSPDHSLVLLNGWRRHQTALVNTYAYGMAAGSSGVDLNALPASAIDRIEVLRDGASAQYGSDAIAGVINVVTKEGYFSPFLNADFGRYTTNDYPDDGSAVNLNGGLGIGLGRGSLGLFAEFRHRDPTNRAWADPSDQIVDDDGDLVDDEGT
jgi:iron complex outermembrane receptor protein